MERLGSRWRGKRAGGEGREQVERKGSRWGNVYQAVRYDVEGGWGIYRELLFPQSTYGRPGAGNLSDSADSPHLLHTPPPAGRSQ